MPQVIEWPSPGPEDIVYRYPTEDITWGAQLIVHEYEVAVFFRDGKAYDTFGPGRHTLTTLNLPLLTPILRTLAGFGETPFKAAVIFIATKQFKGLFGASGQTTDLAPLKFFGAYWLKIRDPKVFVTEAVGGQEAYRTDAVNTFLRGFVNERLISQLARYNLLQVFTKLEEVSFQTKAEIQDEFNRIGIELIDMKFEGMDTTPEYRDRLFWIKQTGTAAQVLRMDTTRDVAESLSKSPGAGVGTGMVLIPQMMQPAPAAGVPLVICPNCSAQVPSSSKFCANCGHGFQAPTPPPAAPKTVECTSCKEQVPADVKFCPNCGHKMG